MLVDKREKINDSNYDPIWCYEFKYDDTGKLLYQVIHDFKSTEDFTITIYDSKQSLISKTNCNTTNSVTSTQEADGNYFNNWCEEKPIHEISDSSGNIIAQILTCSTGPGISPKIALYQYDSNGKTIPLKETIYSAVWVGQISEITYDVNGKIVEERDYRCDASYTI